MEKSGLEYRHFDDRPATNIIKNIITVIGICRTHCVPTKLCFFFLA